MAVNDPYTPGSGYRTNHGSSSVDFNNAIHFCGHCGLYHGAVCPRIRAIEYYPDGSLKRVEYI
jgi:hypothetical protein